MSKKVSSWVRELLTKQSRSQRSWKLRDNPRLPNMRKNWHSLILEHDCFPPLIRHQKSCFEGKTPYRWSPSVAKFPASEKEDEAVGDQLWQPVDGRKSSLSIWPTPILSAATQSNAMQRIVRTTPRVGFSPRLFVSVRGSSLSEPCLYPLFLFTLSTVQIILVKGAHSSFVQSFKSIFMSQPST